MNIKYDYTLNDIKKTINKIRIYKGDTIYISCNLGKLGFPKLKKIDLLPNYLFNIIKKKISNTGTIVAPAHTFFLNNRKDYFDPKKTLTESGSFSNFILKKKNSFRSLHPLASMVAIGKNAKFICKKNTNNSYGTNSPYQKLFSLNTKFISIGIKYNLNCSQVHHVEYLNKVPYRFLKKIKKKIKISGKIKKSFFYIYVLKNKYLNVKRNRNKLIFKNFKKFSKIQKVKLGSNFIYIYNFSEFIKITNEFMKKNKFCWLGKRNDSF